MLERVRKAARERGAPQPHETEAEVRRFLAEVRPGLLAAAKEIAGDAFDRVFSLGVIEEHLRDASVTDIFAFGTRLMVVRNGAKSEEAGFASEEELRLVVDRIAAAARKEASVAEPSVDLTLYDGSRAIVILPPQGEVPYLAVRKHTKRNSSLKELSPLLTGLNPKLASYLAGAVRGRKNLFVAGATGTGKTTLVGALAKEIQENHVLAVLEDTRELFLPHPYVYYLVTRRASDAAREITFSDLIRDSLRLTPDRIILAEVRSPEAAWAFLHALETGHKGSLSTLHADSALDALYRLELLIQEKSSIQLPAIRRLVARTVDIVVHLEAGEDERGNTTSRKIAEVAEVSESGEGYKLTEVTP